MLQAMQMASGHWGVGLCAAYPLKGVAAGTAGVLYCLCIAALLLPDPTAAAARSAARPACRGVTSLAVHPPRIHLQPASGPCHS